jgi:hypothetical protein
LLGVPEACVTSCCRAAPALSATCCMHVACMRPGDFDAAVPLSASRHSECAVGPRRCRGWNGQESTVPVSQFRSTGCIHGSHEALTAWHERSLPAPRAVGVSAACRASSGASRPSFVFAQGVCGLCGSPVAVASRTLTWTFRPPRRSLLERQLTADTLPAAPLPLPAGPLPLAAAPLLSPTLSAPPSQRHPLTLLPSSPRRPSRA